MVATSPACWGGTTYSLMAFKVLRQLIISPPRSYASVLDGRPGEQGLQPNRTSSYECWHDAG